MKGIGEYSIAIVLFGVFPTFPVDSWSAPIIAKNLGLELRDNEHYVN